MKLESIKQENEVKYPTISNVSKNRKKYGKGIMLVASAVNFPSKGDEIPAMYVAVPGYIDRAQPIVAISSQVRLFAIGFAIISAILLIINRIKSSKDEQKEIKRKRRMKIYLGILIASSFISVITFIIKFVYWLVKVI